ncbi:spondin domain-containing protein [Chloroflexota bacterium]
MKYLLISLILTSVLISACGADTANPAITQVAATDITKTSAVISWVTNDPSSSQVEYGTDTSYAASSDLLTAEVTEHSVALSGLTIETIYHYRVKSIDTTGNETISDDYMFMTDNAVVTNYTVIFESTWSAATHPYEAPANPHFSGLIGATHNDSVDLWQEEELATLGIKNMAETGSKDPLNSEIDDAITDGDAYSKLSGGNIPSSPGSASLMFQIHEDYPLVSLVSMIAPSPDWFVGVSSLNLLENDQWVNSAVVELHAYDAGTDSGASFASADSVTTPPVNIHELQTPHFLIDGTLKPLGTFTFTR